MITSTNASADFIGNGTTGPFDITFPFPANSDITVVTQIGTESPITLTEGTDYTLTGSGYFTDGGSITLTLPLAVGTTMTVSRNLSITQPVKFRDLGAFFPQIHEQAIDRLAMICQQLNENFNNMVYSVETAASGSETFVFTDATGGEATVELPASGRVTVVKTDSSANDVIVVPPAGMTILGGAEYRLTAQDEYATFKDNSTNYQKIGG